MASRLVPRLLALAAALLTAAPALAQGPLYTNAQLVSLDVRTRVVVVRTNDGKTQRMRLADGAATPAGLRAGDEVIIAVSREPDMPRISRILRSSRPAPVAPERTIARRGAGAAATEAEPAGDETQEARTALNGRVGAIAQQAIYVDDLWRGFSEYCRPTVRSRYDRPWFALWENDAQVDLSSGFCRDLYNQIVGRGESVKVAMARAEEGALRAGLWPGDVREARRRHGLDWEGWTRPAPTLVPVP